MKIVITGRMKMTGYKRTSREEREGMKEWKRWKEGNCKEEALPFDLVCVPDASITLIMSRKIMIPFLFSFRGREIRNREKIEGRNGREAENKEKT